MRSPRLNGRPGGGAHVDNSLPNRHFRDITALTGPATAGIITGPVEVMAVTTMTITSVGPSKLWLWRGDWHRDWFGDRHFRLHLATELRVRGLWRLGVSQMRRRLVSAEL